jgi:hypothetical protein
MSDRLRESVRKVASYKASRCEGEEQKSAR